MKKRVLICEDDRGIRAFLDKFVGRKGYSVDVAIDGEDCMQKLAATEYDAVLLDLMMPNIDGYQVLEHLRTSKPHTLGKTLVISALPAATKEPPSDVAAFFSKPFDLPILVDKLAEILGATDS